MDLGKGLFGMWAGIKGMNLAKEQFGFNKANILYDRNRKDQIYNDTRNLQAQNRDAARGYTTPNQNMPNSPIVPSVVPSIADQMKKYGV